MGDCTIGPKTPNEDYPDDAGCMIDQYEMVKQAAFQASIKNNLPFQTDFVEIFALCLDRALEQQMLSFERGMEMWERVTFYCETVKRLMAANTRIADLEQQLAWERMTAIERKDKWQENPFRRKKS